MNARHAGDFLHGLQADSPAMYSDFLTAHRPRHKDPDGSDFNAEHAGRGWNQLTALCSYLLLAYSHALLGAHVRPSCMRRTARAVRLYARPPWTRARVASVRARGIGPRAASDRAPLAAQLGLRVSMWRAVAMGVACHAHRALWHTSRTTHVCAFRDICFFFELPSLLSKLNLLLWKKKWPSPGAS